MMENLLTTGIDRGAFNGSFGLQECRHKKIPAILSVAGISPNAINYFLPAPALFVTLAAFRCGVALRAPLFFVADLVILFS